MGPTIEQFYSMEEAQDRLNGKNWQELRIGINLQPRFIKIIIIDLGEIGGNLGNYQQVSIASSSMRMRSSIY